MPRGPPRTSVTLPGLTPISPSVPVVPPTLDVRITFPTGIAASVPTTCPDILRAAKTIGNKSNFLSQYKLPEQKKALQDFIGMLQSSTIDQRQSVDSNQGWADINAYLTTLENTQLPVQRVVNSCLREANEPNVAELEQNRKLRDESKARYEAIRAPEQRTSYYEGWFPLFRPMTEQSLFILFGCALFLLLTSAALFLRMRGIELKVEIPEMMFFGFDVTPYRGYLVAGSIFGVLGVLVAWKFGYLGTK